MSFLTLCHRNPEFLPNVSPLPSSSTNAHGQIPLQTGREIGTPPSRTPVFRPCNFQVPILSFFLFFGLPANRGKSRSCTLSRSVPTKSEANSSRDQASEHAEVCSNAHTPESSRQVRRVGACMQRTATSVLHLRLLYWLSQQLMAGYIAGNDTVGPPSVIASTTHRRRRPRYARPGPVLNFQFVSFCHWTLPCAAGPLA